MVSHVQCCRSKYTQHIRCERVGKYAERTTAELRGWTGEVCIEGKLRYRVQEREDSLKAQEPNLGHSATQVIQQQYSCWPETIDPRPK